MYAKVQDDATVRQITIEVMDGPVLDITRSWHLKPRRIRVERVKIKIVDGETRNLRAEGGLVLKSGGTSQDQGGNQSWGASSYLDIRDHIDKAPAWAQKLWREAPVGVTGWSATELDTTPASL